MYHARNIVEYLDRIIRREEGMDWFRDKSNQSCSCKIVSHTDQHEYLYIKQQ
jgi:hypothetical protein